MKQRFPSAARRTALAIATSALAVAMTTGSQNAVAQSNTTGNVFGTVQPGPDVTVLVENVNTGLKREVKPDAAGRFSATSLPTGTYRATVTQGGKVVAKSNTFDVLIGQGREIAFDVGTGDTTQRVEVIGRVARVDVTSANNGVTFTAGQLAALPIGRNVDAIIQLAANTTRADPRYSGGASFGGGAPSENSYYINGFPVTNPLTQLGASELPFGAISQAQILTGGFGAEFGRSIGGVVNITTKSGGSTWQGGVMASYSPASLRARPKDLYYANTGATSNQATDGTLFRRRSDSSAYATTVGGYLGGPLIADKLSVFVAAEHLESFTSGTNSSTATSAATVAKSGWAERENGTDRAFAKFDWNISADHILELSLISDQYKQGEALSGYDYATGARNGVVSSSASYVNTPNNNIGVGADSQILRYTGFLTQDLTISALVGQSVSEHQNRYGGVNIYSSVRQVRADPSTRFPGFTYPSPYPFAPGTTALADGSEDKVRAARFDVEYKLGASNTLRGGVDAVRLISKNAGEFTAGGGFYRYLRTNNPDLKPNNATTSVQAGGALTSGGFFYYGTEQIFTTVTDARSNQSAFYLEDKWQATKNLILTPGVRVEQYENKNGDNQTFLKVDTQVHPRFQFAWDVMGDKSFKVFGSAGRYGVQIPTHLAVRGASRSTFTRQSFTYQGVDPVTGAPIGRKDLGTPFSSNNEYGQAKDANTVAALNMKPNSQDELTLGLEKALTKDTTFGARATYRRLVNTIDDLCDPRPFEKYATDHNIDTTNWGGFGCASFNPGRSNSFLVDYAGNGNYTRVDLSKEALGFDSARRSYMALDFFLEHAKADGWFGRVTYTYSRNRGNTEGQTLSDVAQTDVAATQTWDHPELMVGAYGDLPNDRRHQIKAIGIYSLNQEWDIGGNLLLASGRPKNCIGNFAGTPSFGMSPDDFNNQISYGSAYRYCTNNGVARFTPRGSEGNLPWDTRLDVNWTFRPSAVKGLSLRMDVFNLFNRQTIEAIDEVHEQNGDPSTVSPTYGRVISYTAPRSVKFTMAYDF